MKTKNCLSTNFKTGIKSGLLTSKRERTQCQLKCVSVGPSRPVDHLWEESVGEKMFSVVGPSEGVRTVTQEPPARVKPHLTSVFKGTVSLVLWEVGGQLHRNPLLGWNLVSFPFPSLKGKGTVSLLPLRGVRPETWQQSFEGTSSHFRLFKGTVSRWPDLCRCAY